MKRARWLSIYVSLACALGMSASGATSNGTANHSRFPGVYLSPLHNGTSMNLSLGVDGTATVTEDAGQGARTLFGHWVDSGSQVTVMFDAMGSKPGEPAMVFAPAHDGLQAVTWNHSSWGSVDPPPMKKGYKVKQLYWLTTGP